MNHQEKDIVIVTLWLFNIAMENGSFIEDVYAYYCLLKPGDFP